MLVSQVRESTQIASVLVQGLATSLPPASSRAELATHHKLGDGTGITRARREGQMRSPVLPVHTGPSPSTRGGAGGGGGDTSSQERRVCNGHAHPA